MKFKYSKFLAKPSEAFPDLKEVWRPVVPIKIINQEKEYGYLALVDSGADFCIFHGDIGELLGLPVRKGKTSPIYGVTKGEGKVYYHQVGLEIGGWHLNSFDLRKRIVDIRPKYL